MKELYLLDFSSKAISCLQKDKVRNTNVKLRNLNYGSVIKYPTYLKQSLSILPTIRKDAVFKYN